MRLLNMTAIGCLALALVPSVADAAVRYSFVGQSDFFITDVTFVHVAPDFVDIAGGGVTTIAFADLQSMSTIPVTALLGISYYERGGGDALSINGAAYGLAYYFPAGSFLHFGTYTAFTGAGAGTLTISAAGVPEPATWGLMFGGLALIGMAMRRRRKPLAA